MHEEGLDTFVCNILRLDRSEEAIDLSALDRLGQADRIGRTHGKIGIIGKYVDLPDAYLSVVESFVTAGFHHGVKVEMEWVAAESVSPLLAPTQLNHLDGIVFPAALASGASRARSPQPVTPESTTSPRLVFALGCK